MKDRHKSYQEITDYLKIMKGCRKPSTLSPETRETYRNVMHDPEFNAALNHYGQQQAWNEEHARTIERINADGGVDHLSLVVDNTTENPRSKPSASGTVHRSVSSKEAGRSALMAIMEGLR